MNNSLENYTKLWCQLDDIANTRDVQKRIISITNEKIKSYNLELKYEQLAPDFDWNPRNIRVSFKWYAKDNNVMSFGASKTAFENVFMDFVFNSLTEAVSDVRQSFKDELGITKYNSEMRNMANAWAETLNANINHDNGIYCKIIPPTSVGSELKYGIAPEYHYRMVLYHQKNANVNFSKNEICKAQDDICLSINECFKGEDICQIVSQNRVKSKDKDKTYLGNVIQVSRTMILNIENFKNHSDEIARNISLILGSGNKFFDRPAPHEKFELN